MRRSFGANASRAATLSLGHALRLVPGTQGARGSEAGPAPPSWNLRSSGCFPFSSVLCLNVPHTSNPCVTRCKVSSDYLFLTEWGDANLITQPGRNEATER